MKTLAKLVLLFGVSLSLGACLARAQSGGDTGYGTCADGSQKSPGEDCRDRLCRSGWAQAHGLGSQCPEASSQHRDRPAPSRNAPKYTPPPQQDSDDAEAREKALAAERARQAAEEKRRQDEKLQQDKADVLSTMKGISSGDLGLKDVAGDSSSNGGATTLGLKGFEANSAADVAKREERKRKQEELAFAKKHSGLRPEPPSPPPPTVPGAMDRIRIALSDDADRLADLRKRGVFSLPQTTRAKIREALLRYLSKHIPSSYAQTYWDINKGAADDTDGIFDAIRKDLAERGELGINTERAIDAFEANLKSRISDAAKDAAKDGLSDAAQQE